MKALDRAFLLLLIVLSVVYAYEKGWMKLPRIGSSVHRVKVDSMSADTRVTEPEASVRDTAAYVVGTHVSLRWVLGLAPNVPIDLVTSSDPASITADKESIVFLTPGTARMCAKTAYGLRPCVIAIATQ